MNDTLTPAPVQPDGRASTVLVFLSLFLLVLAFFIVLVTISTVERVKSRAVLESLNTTFTAVLPTEAKRTDFTAKEGEVLGGQPFQERITNIFSTSVQVAEVEVVKPGRLMRVRMPASALFAAGEARVLEAAQPFLDRVVAALGARPPGLRFDMEFVIGTPVAGDGTLPVGQTPEMARAGAFAREMVARGAPPDGVAIGIAPGDAEQVIMRFYVRQQDDVRLRLLERGRAGPG